MVRIRTLGMALLGVCAGLICQNRPVDADSEPASEQIDRGYRRPYDAEIYKDGATHSQPFPDFAV